MPLSVDEPLRLFFPLLPSSPPSFHRLFFLFLFAWPCPTLSQTLLPLFPQSSPHFLLADNNSNPTNLLDPLPAQTPPTLTIPPALLIPLLALALIAARRQVHRTSCPCHSFAHLIDFPQSVQLQIQHLDLSLRRRDVHIRQTRPHQIKRKPAQKPRRAPCMLMSLIVLILLVLVQVRPFRLDHFSPFSLVFT